MLTLIFILVPAIALFVFLMTRKKNAPEPEPEVVQPKKKEKREPKVKDKKPVKSNKARQPVEQPLETAEKVISLGKNKPVSMAFDPDNKCFFVSCKNRVQLLFLRDAIDKGTNAVQRYSLVDDDIFDVALTNRPSFQVVITLDRKHAIESFKLDPRTSETREGNFMIENAAKYTTDKILISPDGEVLAALGDKTFISVYKQDGTLLMRHDTRQMENYEIALSNDFVTASSYMKEAVFYGIHRDFNSSMPLKVSKAFSVAKHTNSVKSLDFRKNTMEVVSGSVDGSFMVWLCPTRWVEGDIPRPVWTFAMPNKEPVKYVRYSPVAELVAVMNEEQTIYFVGRDGAIKKTVRNAHDYPISNMLFTADGKYIVVIAPSSGFLYAYGSPQ